MTTAIEDRVAHYQTSSAGCSCLGFKYRADCKHVRYVRDKEAAEMPANSNRKLTDLPGHDDSCVGPLFGTPCDCE